MSINQYIDQNDISGSINNYYPQDWKNLRINNLNLDGNVVIQHKTRQSFTPAIEGSVSNPTTVYNSRSSRWSQVGSLCTYQFSLDIASMTGGSGDLCITLPKVAFLGLYQTGTVVISGSPSFGALDTDKGYQIQLLIDNNSDNDVVKIRFTGSGATGLYQVSNNAVVIIGGITYLTNSD